MPIGGEDATCGVSNDQYPTIGVREAAGGGGQARPGRAPLSSHRTGPRHMGGGNLSLQVHPATGYALGRLGMAYTQDESYYILDASSDSRVYLRLHEGVTREGFVGALRRVQAGDGAFDAERWSNRIPVPRHDHVSIPARAVHCSGSDTLDIETGVPIYEQYARDRPRFDFVARPQLVSAVWSDWGRSQVGPHPAETRRSGRPVEAEGLHLPRSHLGLPRPAPGLEAGERPDDAAGHHLPGDWRHERCRPQVGEPPVRRARHRVRPHRLLGGVEHLEVADAATRALLAHGA